MAARDGSWPTCIAAGARLLESACGFCIGNSQCPQTGAVSLRTCNRNFEGRSGTKDAQVYLVSPEVAAVAALTGEVVDPRELGIDYPAVEMPEQFLVDDAMFVFPGGRRRTPAARSSAARTSAPPPANDAAARATSRGVVQIKVGDKITTDHIMPAGARLKYRSNVPKYAEYVFETGRPGVRRPRREADKRRGRHNVIVAGESYGQGSSREHAALCPMYLGVKAVMAKSFERIHAANLVNFGILPLTFADPADYDRVDAGRRAGDAGRVRAASTRGAPLVLVDRTKGVDDRAAATSLSRAPARHHLRGRTAGLHGRQRMSGSDEGDWATSADEDQSRRPRSSRWTATR